MFGLLSIAITQEDSVESSKTALNRMFIKHNNNVEQR